MIESLKRAVEMAGGQATLARAIGVFPQNVWNWLNRDGRASAEKVVAISRATHYLVTPHQLRPDLYPHPDDGLPEELRGRVAA